MNILQPGKHEIRLLLDIIDDRDMTYLTESEPLYHLPSVWHLVDKAIHEPQPEVTLPYDDNF